MPPVQRVIRGDLELFTRMVTVKIFIGVKESGELKGLTGKFGPLILDKSNNAIIERINSEIDSH